MVRSRAFFASVFALPRVPGSYPNIHLLAVKTIAPGFYLFSPHYLERPAGLDCPSIAAAPRFHMTRMRL